MCELQRCDDDGDQQNGEHQEPAHAKPQGERRNRIGMQRVGAVEVRELASHGGRVASWVCP